MMQNIKKSYVVVAIVCVVLLIASFVMNSVSSSLSADVATKQTELSAVKNKISSMSGSRTTENDVSGLSEKRLSSDVDAMASVCKTLFSWDSKDAYSKMRSDITSKYGSAMSAEFVTAVLPVSDSIADGMTVSYKSIEPVVIGAATKARTYFARVMINCSGTDQIVDLGFSVDNDGTVSDFVFYGFETA